MKVIVIGLGIMGSSAAYQLSANGHEVLAFDANQLGHTLGSSHGKTRITRLAYFEAPEYVPLLRRSQELWRQLESQSGKTLMALNGGLFIGDPDSPLVAGSLASARSHDLPHDLLTAREINQRFPCFAIPDGFVGLFERPAGVLFAEECLHAYLELAVRNKAQLHFNEPVISFDADQQGVSVVTTGGGYEADALVVTAGPWSPSVLAELNLPMQAVRVWYSYFQPDDALRFSADRCPIYCIADDNGFFYGFPHEEGAGMKIARHGSERFSGGKGGTEDCTPQTCRRDVSQEEVELMRLKLAKYLPGAASAYSSSTTCLYTMTADEHFIVEADATDKNVVYACGFSGHGFKFGSVMGEVITDLLCRQASRHNIDFLSSRRFVSTERERIGTETPSRPAAR